MTIEPTGKSRTLSAYAADLLQFPRWVIERQVDFTNCKHGARFSDTTSDCIECRFGPACYWLNCHRTPNTDNASLREMTGAIESACDYLSSLENQSSADKNDIDDWIREAHRFLGSQRS